MPENLPAEISHPRLFGLVLCGGQSKRMGIDKSLLRHSDGMTFLEFALQRLCPLTDQVLLGGMETGHPLQNVSDHAPFRSVPDRRPNRGPVEGIVSAMRFVQQQTAACDGRDGLLVTPVDMPDLRTPHLAALVEAFIHRDQQARSPTPPEQTSFQQRSLDEPSPFPVCACIEHDRPEPLVAIYPFCLLPELEAVSNSESRSLSRWLNKTPHERCVLPSYAGANINRPQDLRDYEDRC